MSLICSAEILNCRLIRAGGAVGPTEVGPTAPPALQGSRQSKPRSELTSGIWNLESEIWNSRSHDPQEPRSRPYADLRPGISALGRPPVGPRLAVAGDHPPGGADAVQ